MILSPKPNGLIDGPVKEPHQLYRALQKEEIQYLKELIKNNFEIMIVGVFAYPLTQSWLGKKIDKDFITRVEELKRKYNIHPAGEGGEFETFVINCPLFMRRLKVKSFKDFNEG